MGAHFSPCGRFLAACVACVLPHVETDPGTQMQMHQDVVGAATSPTRHPIAAHRIVYELRIYSLEEATYDLILYFTISLFSLLTREIKLFDASFIIHSQFWGSACIKSYKSCSLFDLYSGELL